MTAVSARLRAIARQTVTIVADGRYRSPAGREVGPAGDITAAVAGTRVYAPGDLVSVPAPGCAAPGVEVTGETSLRAARRLGGTVACLVFASAKNPGGGSRTGAQAQEESIARASALHACLESVPEFYFHRQQRDLRYSDCVIYSPAVPVFRDDTGSLLEEPYPVSFLTCAAPNLGAILRNQPGDAATVPDVPAGGNPRHQVRQLGQQVLPSFPGGRPRQVLGDDQTPRHAHHHRDMNAARRAGGGARRPGRSGRTAPADGLNTTKIREWAKAEGIEVKDRAGYRPSWWPGSRPRPGSRGRSRRPIPPHARADDGSGQRYGRARARGR
jgi:hypothetical protein